MEDRFINFGDDEDGLDERNVRGLASILGDVRSDLRLLEADMMAEVDRDVAEFKKRRAEEKKASEGPQVNVTCNLIAT